MGNQLKIEFVKVYAFGRRNFCESRFDLVFQQTTVEFHLGNHSIVTTDTAKGTVKCLDQRQGSRFAAGHFEQLNKYGLLSKHAVVSPSNTKKAGPSFPDNRCGANFKGPPLRCNHRAVRVYWHYER